MENTTKTKTKNELKIGIVLSYFLIALNVVSGFLLVPFIIKNIGQSNYGLYFAASSLVTMFIIDLGLGTAVTKFVSKYRVTSTQEEINKLISVVFTCFVFLAVIIAIIFSIMFIFLGNIYSSFTEEEIESFKIVFIIVASYSVLIFPLSIYNGILVAYDKIFLLKIADITSKIIFIISTILVLHFNLGLYMLTLCFAIHGVTGAFLKIIFAKTNTPVHFAFKMTKNEFKNIFKEVISFSLWAAVNTFGRVILVSFAPTILGFTLPDATGSKEIAVFSIAIQIESYVSLFATAFGSIFYPSISRILFSNGLDYKESLPEFAVFHTRIARIQVSILSLVILGLIVLGMDFLELWVGSGYSLAYYSILLLCIPGLFFYPLQTAENAIAAIDKIKYCAFSTIISLVVGILFSIIFSYLWGSIGAAVGIFIGLSTRTILFNLVFKRFLDINPVKFYYRTYASFILPFLLTAILGVGLNFLFKNPSWLNFILRVLIVTIFYSLIVYFIGLNKEEKGKINSSFRKVFKRN